MPQGYAGSGRTKAHEHIANDLRHSAKRRCRGALPAGLEHGWAVTLSGAVRPLRAQMKSIGRFMYSRYSATLPPGKGRAKSSSSFKNLKGLLKDHAVAVLI
jgi:hypothetical protein